jgi:hypothetical protein
MTVIGLPRMRIALALPRSRFVNQRARNTTIAGSTAASTAPSRKRTTISHPALCSRPCTAASTPQAKVHQKISPRTLCRSA